MKELSLMPSTDDVLSSYTRPDAQPRVLAEPTNIDPRAGGGGDDLTSTLAAIEGVSKKAAAALAVAFTTRDAVAAATLAQLQDVDGIGAKTAAAVRVGFGGDAKSGNTAYADVLATTLNPPPVSSAAGAWASVKVDRNANRLLDELVKFANRDGAVVDKQEVVSAIVVGYGVAHAALLKERGINWQSP
jgi:hypothetical protein